MYRGGELRTPTMNGEYPGARITWTLFTLLNLAFWVRAWGIENGVGG